MMQVLCGKNLMAVAPDVISPQLLFAALFTTFDVMQTHFDHSYDRAC